MIGSSHFAMPKAAFFICFLFCGNFILSGKTAEQCPKNPLAPTSSVSGMVVGTIVSTEKLVNGVMSFFFYLGQNSINQVLGVSSQFEGLISKYTMKLHDFAGGLVSGVGSQLKSIYSGSTGSIRILFDSIIKVENSAQKFVYTQVESVASNVVSGKLTGGIAAAIRSPISAISSVIKKAKNNVVKLSSSIRNNLKEVIVKVKTSGIPTDVKDILEAPIKGVKEFIKEGASVVQTVKNETSQRISGYSSGFKTGGIIDKVVALGSLPVGISLEVWSFTLKISDAAKKSISVSVKDVVQPFLGQILTERLGKIVNLPLDITEGFYKSAMNFFSGIGGIISGVTGGGSVGVQINMVLKHPIIVLENAWNTTKKEVKDFSKATIGEDLTEQLAGALSSPGKALSGLLSSVTGGKFMVFLNSPIMFLEKIWSQAKMTIEGLTKGVLGEKFTMKISGVLSAPGKAISNLVASITGGGSISTQIKTVFSSPIQTIKRVWSSLSIKILDFTSSITGGGGLAARIKTVLTEPYVIFENIWSKIKSTTESLSKTLLGGGLSKKLSQVFSAPFATVSGFFNSITSKLFGFSASIRLSAGGGGNGTVGGGFGGAIQSLIQSPIDVVEGTFRGIVKAAKSLMHSFEGFYSNIPFIGKNSIKADVDVKVGKHRTNAQIKIGGQGGVDIRSDSEGGGKLKEGARGGAGGKLEAKSRRRRRSAMA